MRIKPMWLWLMIGLLLGVTGCFENKNDFSKQGVCILDETSLRSGPSKKADWLSSLALGETVKLEGTLEKDAADPTVEYIKISLSDGTVGYANAYCIVRSAYVGVVQDAAKIYKRPDLLAESGSKFEMMQIVAVEEEKDNWLRVTGERRSKVGWIEKDAIRKDKEDIVTALKLRKAMRGKANISREEMDKIVAGLPNPNNYFVAKIMEKYESAIPADQDQNAVGQQNDMETPPPQDNPAGSNPQQ